MEKKDRVKASRSKKEEWIKAAKKEENRKIRTKENKTNGERSK